MGITKADEAKLKSKKESGELSHKMGMACGCCPFFRIVTTADEIGACGLETSEHFCHMLSCEHPACGEFG